MSVILKRQIELVGAMNRALNDPAAVVLYLSMMGLKGQGASPVRASLQELADLSGLSKSTVQRAVKKLELAGYLKGIHENQTATPLWKLMKPKGL